MAANPSSHGLVPKEKIEELVTCPVCHEVYTDPKALPCQHVFCQTCLEGMPLNKINEAYYFYCPICRRLTEERPFPVAILANNLESLIKKPPIPTCSDHRMPLDIFCNTCDTVICYHCSIQHPENHERELINKENFTKHCEKVKECLLSIEGKKEVLKKVQSALAEREDEIRRKGEGILEEIHDMVEEMMNVLRQSERKLTEQAKRVVDAKLKVLSEQIESAKLNLSLLDKVKNDVEQKLKTGSPQQVLRSKKQMMECISDITVLINVEELHPKEKADFELSKDIKPLHHIGDIVTYSSTTLQQCRLKKISCFERLPKMKKISFSLSMEAPDSSRLYHPVSSFRCSLVPDGKGKPIHTTVTTTSTDPGVYKIQCNLSTSGTHTDNITPGPVQVITELKGPWGVAVCDDHVIITECADDCVTILDREGKKVKSLGGKGGSGNVKFSSPCGLAITPDKCILVSDNHRIQKISMNGFDQMSVGEEGSGPLQFKCPDGIAISPVTGQIYVADENNHRIQVLNPDLTFSHSFGSKGSANGQFKSPRDIAIDSQGLVYVADCDNDRIQKFSPDKKFVGQFGNKRYGSGQLKSPIGITIDTAAKPTSLVYVSELGNHCISVFTSEGGFISRLDCHGSKVYLKGLKLDEDGFLYVCDYRTNKLFVY
uniref:RING-type domain-containing protein n=1 Tax=Amphimedon queenslandica TaxID=400682 RepID=A0A1X7TJD7_AMPQE